MPQIPLLIRFNQKSSQTIKQQKIAQFGLAYRNLTPKIDDLTPPLKWATEIKTDHLSKNKIKHIAYRTHVLNGLCTELLPLLDDESETPLVKNLYILSNEWYHLPKGTPVIQRRTNHADYYFFAPAIHYAEKESYIYLESTLRLSENIILQPLNLTLTNDELLNIALKINMIIAESAYGYGLNNLLALRYAILPKYAGFHTLIQDTNNTLPIPLNSIRLQDHIETLMKITYVCEETVDMILEVNRDFNSIIDDALTEEATESFTLIELFLIFSIDLALKKDLLVYQKTATAISVEITPETLLERSRQYAHCLRMRLNRSQQPQYAYLITEAIEDWIPIFENELRTFDTQMMLFREDTEQDYSRKIYYSQKYFLKQINAKKELKMSRIDNKKTEDLNQNPLSAHGSNHHTLFVAGTAAEAVTISPEEHLTPDMAKTWPTDLEKDGVFVNTADLHLEANFAHPNTINFRDPLLNHHQGLKLSCATLHLNSDCTLDYSGQDVTTFNPDTLRGDDGYPGGKITLIIEEAVIANGNTLTLKVNGGAGGNGKDGKHGDDNTTPPTHGTDDQPKYDDPCCGAKSIIGIIPGGKATPGKKGGPGKAAGNGGNGAQGGIITVMLPEGTDPSFLVIDVSGGKPGKPGICGQGGQGSMGGKEGVRLIYRPAWVDPARKEGLQISHPAKVEVNKSAPSKAKDGDPGDPGPKGSEGDPGAEGECTLTPGNTLEPQVTTFILSKL